MFNELMEKLLSLEIVSEANGVVFTAEAKEIVKALAGICMEKRVAKKAFAEGKVIAYYSEDTAEDVYLDMLYKMDIAPTSVHMVTAIYIAIPIIAQKLGVIECIKF